jgi:ribonucleoside-diphosphate reductase alpha chain
MVCLDADHPDIEHFVNWKVREELKVAAMVEGLKHLGEDQKAVADKIGLELDYDFNGEAYYTVSGQNSNNSVRLTDEFFSTVERDGDWELSHRTDGENGKTIKARDLWDQISFAAWRCADPGIQYDTTINAWHTCPESGRINASNPCSEYMFLDNTACNLASINLMKFFDAEQRKLDLDAYEHAIDLWTIVLEVSVLMAAFPSKAIAEQSYRYRTLGLGYANLGAVLMQAGIPYDSDEARAVCGAITSILTGRSYATSARMAGELGPFPGYRENRQPMLRVIRNHRRAAHGLSRDSNEYEALDVRPVPIDHDVLRSTASRIENAQDLLDRATTSWDDALDLGHTHGYRNAQVTVIAPTGTIGLLMDCDTTGVEPDFALTKFKKLAGGGYFKIANQSLRPALQTLGYTREQIVEILTYVMGTLSLDTPMSDADSKKTFRDLLRDAGYTDSDLETASNQLPSVFELGFAFNAWSMPETVLEKLGVDVEAARSDSQFNGLRALGLDDDTVDRLNRTICGTQTIEGAPHLSDEHLPVFDCANKCGKIGRRYIAPEGHIRMMAAAQPFVTGAISKTINLPAEASVDDIAASYWLSWELGLKANALYRDGSKLSQPLSATTDESVAEDDDEDAVEDARAEVSVGVAELASAISGAEERPPVEKIVERIIERPMRRRLPDTRRSLTHRFNVAGHEGYLTAGLYEDGSPGELFITMSKEGSTIGGLMDSLGTAISVALQYGVPIESLVKKFEHNRFEPMGMTTNRDIPFAKSLVDYIFRWLGMQFISGYREANAPKRTPRPEPIPPTTAERQVARGPEARGQKNDRVKEDNKWSHSDGEPNGRGDGRNGGAPARTDGKPADAAGEPDASVTTIDASSEYGAVATGLDRSNAALQGDAPACEVCGSITVRNGTCYKCLNCGNSMGCS